MTARVCAPNCGSPSANSPRSPTQTESAQAPRPSPNHTRSDTNAFSAFVNRCRVTIDHVRPVRQHRPSHQRRTRKFLLRPQRRSSTPATQGRLRLHLRHWLCLWAATGELHRRPVSWRTHRSHRGQPAETHPSYLLADHQKTTHITHTPPYRPNARPDQRGRPYSPPRSSPATRRLPVLTMTRTVWRPRRSSRLQQNGLQCPNGFRDHGATCGGDSSPPRSRQRNDH